jgi:hypothetical protein
MAKKDAAPVEVEVAEERDYTALMAKEPGELYTHLLAWIIDKTGIAFATKKESDAFAKGVEATLKLRTYHQASEENQERLAAAKEAGAAAKAQRAAEKAAAKDTDEDEAPAKTAKPGKGKTVTTEVETTPAPAAKPAKTGPKKATTGKGKAPF